MSQAVKAILTVLAIAAAIVLFIILSEDEANDSSSTNGPPPAAEEPEKEPGKGDSSSVPTIVVKNGAPVGGIQELEYTAGERIRFAVRSDVSDHVHLHGYDVIMDITGGGRVEFDVPAKIEGVFEVELEESVVQLAEIRVKPG